jgi:RHH-type proline utilization regulon transcriptional repressor/proline dehydrogenase/delta 1-pyrroline-5-carboxylate dehydrogenase
MKSFIAPAGYALATPVGEALNGDFLAEELPLVRTLAQRARLPAAARARIAGHAVALVAAVRAGAGEAAGIDEFLQSYGLESQEGVLLLCLAEALLRIPDNGTADQLIADRLARGDWRAHFDDEASLFVNASTFALMLSGRLFEPAAPLPREPVAWIRRVLARLGEPVARTALRHAMGILSGQFIFGVDLPAALARAATAPAGTRHSFDMLGEGALCRADAARHLAAYHTAIVAIGRACAGDDRSLMQRDGVSIKLSALHPRYELAQRERVLRELLPAMIGLLEAAAAAGIALTIDAEESERLELSLLLFEPLLAHPAAQAPAQLGLALQAYQKRAPRALDWLVAAARARGRRIHVRLVKGAYWDTEVKRAQQAGLAEYPVYTRKPHTDIAYLVCARQLAAARDTVSAQFATHNAHTVAYVSELYRDAPETFEFQRLHGMGHSLYEAVARGVAGGPRACRVYAPVGPQSELLPYLVRRLLENGANASFVHRAADRDQPAAAVVADPTDVLDAGIDALRLTLPRPVAMFGTERRNSPGIQLHDSLELAALARACESAGESGWLAQPLVGGGAISGATEPVVNPADLRELPGECVPADRAQLQAAAAQARHAWRSWDAQGGERRAAVLEQAAGLFERERAGLIARVVCEAGRTISDSLSEWREAVDFLRYYAARARGEFSGEQALPGPAGESNSLRLRGRGVFGCISPWNFPLAIFTGQVAAALAAGNAVLAKPAGQTPLGAALVVQLLHEAGVPPEVLHFLPGGGDLGAALSGLEALAGVAFTGSTLTAQRIARALAARTGPIAALIAETGGQNALLADSSALLEQLVLDLLASSFNSAGQRCSAVRVLYVQQELAPRLLDMLTGAMDELVVGDPARIDTDIGPLIDAGALARVEAHVAGLAARGQLLHRTALPAGLAPGHYCAPALAEIGSIAELEGEVFGPVLHLVRYRAGDLAAVVEDINDTGFGLTLGIHTRIESRARAIAARARVGNVYVNRNTIGAVVGVQPFGGCGLSGTGPKAGGPHYLARFATEQSLSINTAAVGGNADLLSQE